MQKIYLQWQEPLALAKLIADKYQKNWVLLYSALHKNYSSSKSYIGLFESEKFSDDDFAKLPKFIEDNKKSKCFGYLSYELAQGFDNILKTQKSAINFPKIYFSCYDLVLEFEHHTKKLLANFKTQKNLDNFFKIIAKPDETKPYDNKKNQNLPIKINNLASNFSDVNYLKSIEDIKKMIANGDFIQANLTRKFSGEFDKKLSSQQNFQLFLDLTKTSPANYSCYFRIDDKSIISSTPELFLRSKNKQIFSIPIKGSIARGGNKKQDLINKKYLKNSPKERAENLMIVDLMRNDFSRFCKVGSVEVKKLFAINSYKTIHHMSSQIEGKIADNRDIFDAIRACFPAGSMTGAPKIKAMNILSKIEKFERGIYSGTIGFIDEKQQANLAVVIRTLLIDDVNFEFQVGGAITFDSKADSELEEIYTKAQAIIKTLKIPDKLLKKLVN